MLKTYLKIPVKNKADIKSNIERAKALIAKTFHLKLYELDKLRLSELKRYIKMANIIAEEEKKALEEAKRK